MGNSREMVGNQPLWTAGNTEDKKKGEKQTCRPHHQRKRSGSKGHSEVKGKTKKMFPCQEITRHMISSHD